MGTVSAKEPQRLESVKLKKEYEDTADLPNFDAPAKVKNIHIEGLKRSKDNLLMNSLKSLFKVTSFDKLLSEAHFCKLRLERLGVFSDVDVFVDVTTDDVAGTDIDSFDVYFFVAEKRFVTGSTGTTVGNNEANVILSGNFNNIKGGGESVSTKISYGTSQTSSFEFSFSKPLFNHPDKKFSLRALKSVSDFTQSYYRETSRGFGTDFTLPSVIGLHTLSWDYYWRENSVLSSAPFTIRQHSGHSLKSGLRHTLVSDGRDDWILPSSGHLLKHSVELSDFLGNVRLLKTDVELQLNKQIFHGIVLAASLNAGMTKSLGGKEILLNDRNFLGGPASVRGYMFKGIGFQSDVGDGVNSASVGGDMYWASGVHLYTPLPFLGSKSTFSSLFRTHFFVNAGNITNTAKFNQKDFLMNPRWSYGVGIMFMLGGMARLELNYCFPQNARAGDRISEGIQVGVGINFL